MALIHKIKNTFRAVELLVYMKDYEALHALHTGMKSIGTEYYLVKKNIGSNFVYFHINTAESSVAFDRIIDLGLELQRSLRQNSNMTSS
jgi:hypothetical protein